MRLPWFEKVRVLPLATIVEAGSFTLWARPLLLMKNWGIVLAWREPIPAEVTGSEGEGVADGGQDR